MYATFIPSFHSVSPFYFWTTPFFLHGDLYILKEITCQFCDAYLQATGLFSNLNYGTSHCGVASRGRPKQP